jgi:hypothetical protein
MTNEEIIEDYYYDDDLDHSYIDAEDFQELMNKARADEHSKLAGLYFSKEAVDAMIAEERAKLSKEGRKIWVSWDTQDEGVESNPCLTDSKPERVGYLGRNYFDLVKCTLVVELSEDFAEHFGVNSGECKAFEIRECEV